MKTHFVNRQEFLEDIKIVLEVLDKSLFDAETLFTEDLYVIENNTYHAVARLLKTDTRDRRARAFCSLLFRDVYKAEKLSAGAGVVAFRFGLELAKRLMQNDLLDTHNQSDLLKDWDNYTENLKTLVDMNATAPNKANIGHCVRRHCKDKDLSRACLEAIKLAGLHGKIIVNNSKHDHYIVEMKNGYNFKLEPYGYFLEENKPWTRRDCKILTVDGFIETVAELDRVLNQAHETKQPLVLVAQGFSEEVVATLHSNYRQGKLDVMPLRLMSDINNLNVMNDIGTVCGRDPLSATKGELLTFVKLAELPSVDRITVLPGRTTIENMSTVEAVLEQIKGLLKKRDDNQYVEDVQTLYENRIKSLSPLIVVINLPEMDAIKSDTYRIRLDDSLREVKSILNYGLISEYGISSVLTYDEISDNWCPPEDSNMSNSELESMIFGIMSYVDYSYCSALSYYLGTYLVGKTVINFLSSAGFVEIDLDESLKQ